MTQSQGSSAEPEAGTPVMETMVLPPVEYTPEGQEFIDNLVYSFPPSACCK